MMKTILMISLLLFATVAFAADMVAVRPYTANVHSTAVDYDYNLILKLPRYYPLAVDEEEDGFLKVSDYSGELGWIKASDVNETNTVVVKARHVNVRKGPSSSTSALFLADQGVCFRVLEKKDRWLKVRHESGEEGWIFRGLTWGSR